MKPITHLNRCRLTAEQKQEILRDGERGFWGAAEGIWHKNTFYVTNNKRVAADTFAGFGRNKEKKQMGFTFAHK